MTTVIRLEADELDERFLAVVKAAYPGRTLKITVTTDLEAEFLRESQANH